MSAKVGANLAPSVPRSLGSKAYGTLKLLAFDSTRHRLTHGTHRAKLYGMRFRAMSASLVEIGAILGQVWRISTRRVGYVEQQENGR